MYPYLTYEEFLDACGLTEEGAGPCVKFSNMNAGGFCSTSSFCRPRAGAAGLRRHGAGERDHPRRLPHRALLPLELWGLSQPDVAPLVGRGIVLSDLLHLGQGAAGDGRSPTPPPWDARRYAWARCAAALAGTALYGAVLPAGSGSVLWPLLRLVCVGQPAASSAGDPRPALVFALGCGWLLARIRPWLLYPWMLLPFAGGGPAPARSAGAVERQPLYRPSRSLWGRWTRRSHCPPQPSSPSLSCLRVER